VIAPALDVTWCLGGTSGSVPLGSLGICPPGMRSWGRVYGSALPRERGLRGDAKGAADSRGTPLGGSGFESQSRTKARFRGGGPCGRRSVRTGSR
jgi:hypothetical protein